MTARDGRQLAQQRIESGDFVERTLTAGSAPAGEQVGQRGELGLALQLGGVAARPDERILEQLIDLPEPAAGIGQLGGRAEACGAEEPFLEQLRRARRAAV